MIVTVTMVASFLPALRASRGDPVTALRHESTGPTPGRYWTMLGPDAGDSFEAVYPWRRHDSPGSFSPSAPGLYSGRRPRPRSSTPASTRTSRWGWTFLQFGYARSTGNILIDQSLPVEGLDATLNLTQLKYGRTIDFFGKSGKVEALLPVAFGHWTGTEIGVGDRERNITGLADARLTLNVNFVGSPALGLREWRQFRQKTIVGAVLQVVAPTGQYDPSKLINIGANRWSLKSEIGVSRAIARWHVEGAGTLWLFADNQDYLGGQTLSQEAVLAIQGHVVYTFRPGLWLGLDVGYLDGGTTTIDGNRLNTLQSNSRAGLTLQIPFARRHGIRFAYSRGVRTRIGADFTTLVVGYQVMWGQGF